MKIIELFDKQTDETGENVHLIAECNLYNENGVFIKQFSRSPFVFPNTMTDEEIITSLTQNEYNIYF